RPHGADRRSSNPEGPEVGPVLPGPRSASRQGGDPAEQRYMNNTTMPLAVVLLITSAIASTAFLRAADTATTPLPSAACVSVQGLVIPASDIGLASSGAVVQSAVSVAGSEKGNVSGDFCKVIGIIKPKHPGSPNLEFE